MGRLLVLPLAKSAWSEGRIGPPWLQDWHRGAVMAAHLAEDLGAQVLVVTGFITSDGRREADFYREVFAEHDIEPVVLGMGTDTVSQLAAAFEYVKRNDAHLIIVSTFLHYPRVRWLTRGKKVTHRVAWGIPRPLEAVTDIAATVPYIILDALGMKSVIDRILAWVAKRRAAGKLF